MTNYSELIALVVAGLAGYYICTKLNPQSTDTGGNTYNNTYVPSPDEANPNHPFHNTPLDFVYDMGWNTMGWFRAVVL